MSKSNQIGYTVCLSKFWPKFFLQKLSQVQNMRSDLTYRFSIVNFRHQSHKHFSLVIYYCNKLTCSSYSRLVWSASASGCGTIV
jgi:hypothetical protein